MRDSPDFDHLALTGFELEGQHRTNECRTCHEALEFSFVATACRDCHEDVHAGSLGADCETCHEPTSWTNRSRMRDVHSATLFPLTGTHAALDCASCHGGAPPFDFASTPTDCFACHAAQYQQAREPNHVEAGFPTACEQCHGTNAWDESRFGGGPNFDHSAFFPLEGAHAAADCSSCHIGGRYAGTPRDCVGCHRAEYEQTSNPAHVNAGFPTSCETCHSATQWLGAEFNHNQFFKLTGAHRAVDCEECHTSGLYQGTPRECFSCHQQDFDQARSPNHARAGFPVQCELCHETRDWNRANFNHEKYFPLTGAHRNADCESCHANGVYQGTPTDCVACHQAEYDQTRDPNHAAAGFPTTCETCHSTKRWDGATFDHAQFFRLTGAHRSVDCESCHTNGKYQGTPRDCYSCHQFDYDRTNDPNHASAGFPTTCETCHDTSKWDGATFDHDQFFRLTGAHRSVDCDSCHANGKYQGTPRDCYSCHKSDYDRTRDPNHAAAGFPTTCETCHDTGKWDGATFDHDQFFRLTGAHRSVDCESCHTNGKYQGTPRDCYSCHRSDYDRTNDPNHASAGFPTTCETCHNTNGWDGASFDHGAFFPIRSGPHRLDCAECHVVPSNFAVFECIECHEHRKSEMDSDHREVRGYSWVSLECYRCHPNGRS